MDQQPSYYEVLRVTPIATDEDVKEAYRSLAKKFHPDRNPHNRRIAELRLRLINEAYAHLQTDEKRQAYNQSLRLKADNDNEGSKFFAQISDIFWSKKPTRRTKNTAR